MTKTSIEWTHRPGTTGYSWNPIRARRTDIILDSSGRDANGTRLVGWACTHASPGCLQCYAETINRRFGTRLKFDAPSLGKVEFFIDEKELEAPLRLKKPATIFVGDMFDLFHESIPREFIGQVLAIPGIRPATQHTFQFLTKRAARMQAIIEDITCFSKCDPPANMWVGVSCESQKYADERIPLLVQTPAAVRFISVEPQLEEISLRWMAVFGEPYAAQRKDSDSTNEFDGLRKLDWVICGGESGPQARPFNLNWAEKLREECKAAGVAFFMKQVGSKPLCSEPCANQEPHFCGILKLKDRKGGDLAEWPESLMVREFPA